LDEELMGRHFRVGQIYRYAAQQNKTTPTLDGFENFHFITNLSDKAQPQLDKGIAPIGKVKVPGLEKERTPAILISSTLHGKGSASNPWRDIIDSDRGFIQYFGDTKKQGNPQDSPGNKLLLKEFAKHTAGAAQTRRLATPLLVFESVPHNGKIKGFKRFAGLAVIEKVELVTQYNAANGYFTNYVFQFAVLSLSPEDERVNWAWINDRRNESLENEATLEYAPKAWKQFVKHGLDSTPSIRRKVIRGQTVKPEERRKLLTQVEGKTLSDIYKYYSEDSTKHRFELLASLAVMEFVNSNGGSYQYGWLTRGSGDGGVDFVGKIKLGSGFSSTEVIVLGQAKCEDPTKATNANHLARTVARLKRGWVGAYVTTSYYSVNSQEEIIEDDYPLIKIDGLVLAQCALRLKEAAGFKSMKEYLIDLDKMYPERIESKRPEDILLEN
jgi:hypothetical protein